MKQTHRFLNHILSSCLAKALLKRHHFLPRHFRGFHENEIDGISVVRTKFGEVQGLPEPDGNIYIVSMVVAQAVSGRSDVIAPDTGPTAYRENGLIVGVRQFARY